MWVNNSQGTGKNMGNIKWGMCGISGKNGCLMDGMDVVECFMTLCHGVDLQKWLFPSQR